MIEYTYLSQNNSFKYGSYQLPVPTEIPIGLKSFLITSLGTNLHIGNVPYYSTDDKVIIRWTATGRYRKSEKHAEYQKTLRTENLSTDWINAVITEQTRIELEREMLTNMFDECCKAIATIGDYKESNNVLQR